MLTVRGYNPGHINNPGIPGFFEIVSCEQNFVKVN